MVIFSQRIEVDLSSFGSFKPNTHVEFTDLPDAFLYGGVDVQIKGLMTVTFKEPPFEGDNARDALARIIVAIKDRVIPNLKPFVRP